MNSCLYVGRVTHERPAPRRHRLDYRLFYCLLDLDELEALDASSRLFGYNRRACLAFHDADHGAGDGRSFRAWLTEAMVAFGVAGRRWRFRALLIPRVFGYVFNPITVVYCHDEDGTLVAMLYEVNNTFGERVSYLAPVRRAGNVIRQRCDKSLFVSPFFDMNGHYDFTLTRPGEALRLSIAYAVGDETRLTACFAGTRRALSPAALRSVLLRYPGTALKVVAGIHYEALKLWAKGTPLVRHVAADGHHILPGNEL